MDSIVKFAGTAVVYAIVPPIVGLVVFWLWVWFVDRLLHMIRLKQCIVEYILNRKRFKKWLDSLPKPQMSPPKTLNLPDDFEVVKESEDE